MDGQNFDNRTEMQSDGSAQQGSNGQYSNYQDYTADIPYQAPVENAGPKKANGLQIASLVLGIIGIPACCCYGIPGILFGVIGLILAIIGNRKNKGVGVGIAGLVCSIIAIALGIVALIYYAWIIAEMVNNPSFYSELLQQLESN